MMKAHGDPARELPRGQIAITRDDIKSIPEIIAKSQEAQHAGRFINADTIRYFYDDPKGGTTTVLDEVRGKRGWLVPAQMIKFKKSGVRKVPYQGSEKGKNERKS